MTLPKKRCVSELLFRRKTFFHFIMNQAKAQTTNIPCSIVAHINIYICMYVYIYIHIVNH